MKGIWVPNSWLNEHKPEDPKSHRYFRNLCHFTEGMYLNFCEPLTRSTRIKIILLLFPLLIPHQHRSTHAIWLPGTSATFSLGKWCSRWSTRTALAAAEKPFSNGICKTTNPHKRQEHFIILHNCFSPGYHCSQMGTVVISLIILPWSIPDDIYTATVQ